MGITFYLPYKSHCCLQVFHYNVFHGSSTTICYLLYTKKMNECLLLFEISTPTSYFRPQKYCPSFARWPLTSFGLLCLAFKLHYLL